MPKLSRSLILVGFLAIPLVAVIVLMYQSLPTGIGRLGARLLLFNTTAFESLFVLALVFILSNQKGRLRFVGYALFFASLVSYLTQGICLFLGGEFLSRLALENISHIEFISGTWVMLTGVLVVATGFFGIFFLDKKLSLTTWPSFAFFWLPYFFLAILCHQSKALVSTAVRAEANELQSYSRNEGSSPLVSFGKVWFAPPLFKGTLSEVEVAAISELGFQISSKAFPFVREKIYSRPAPLPPSKKPLNVMLLFVEGMSARSLEIYGAKYENLTPNLTRFSKRTTVIENYWNHTAASYRGMKGQLCSLIPVYDGVEKSEKGEPINYFCLPHLFKEAKYETVFLNAHRKNSSFLDEMMPELGFAHVLSAEQMASQFLHSEKTGLGFSLTDHQFFRALRGWMEQNRREKFFLSAYNMGTHAFLDVGPAEKKYGNGGNSTLNTIHNFDHAFGEFLDYFEKSPYAQNTVIFLTSDHAHYSEPSFVSAFDSKDYLRLFIDRIPLLIYDPRAKFSSRLDAKSATSISLAPTMAHYLALPNGVNPFFGKSLFEIDHEVGVAGFGSLYLWISKGKVENIGDIDSPNTSKRAIRRYLEISARMEMENRIWDPALRVLSPQDLL